METVKEHHTERMSRNSTEYAVLFVLLLASSGLFFGFSVATIIGVLNPTG